ncbi:hypothetical protein Bca101_020141 [Brassica carinata]
MFHSFFLLFFVFQPVVFPSVDLESCRVRLRSSPSPMDHHCKPPPEACSSPITTGSTVADVHGSISALVGVV